MKNFLYATFICLVIVSVGCKQDAPQKQVEEQTQVQNTSGPIYPVLPSELALKLFHEADLLDFIFHDLPFSMSQSEKPSIQTNISYIGNDPVMEIPQGCKSIARQFYQIQGEIILESDVYYSEGCYFYIFYEDGQAKYANMMSTNGIGFFGNVLQQAINASKNIGG